MYSHNKYSAGGHIQGGLTDCQMEGSSCFSQYDNFRPSDIVKSRQYHTYETIGKKRNNLANMNCSKNADQSTSYSSPTLPHDHNDRVGSSSYRHGLASGYDVIRKLPQRVEKELVTNMERTSDKQSMTPSTMALVVHGSSSRSSVHSDCATLRTKTRKRFGLLDFGGIRWRHSKCNGRIIDLNKNRILSPPAAHKSSKQKRSLINLRRIKFRCTNTKASSTSSSVHSTPQKEDKKVDLEMIWKLEEEIYKCREQNKRLTRQRVSSEPERDVMFLNDNSAFAPTSQPVLQIDSLKFDPMLMKSARQDDEKAEQLKGSDGCQSIVVVDNSEYYPVLMKYEIRTKAETPSSTRKDSVMSFQAGLEAPPARKTTTKINENAEPHIRESKFRRFLQQRRSLNLSFWNKRPKTELAKPEDDYAVVVLRNKPRHNNDSKEHEKLRNRVGVVTNDELCRSILECDSLRLLAARLKKDVMVTTRRNCTGPVRNFSDNHNLCDNEALMSKKEKFWWLLRKRTKKVWPHLMDRQMDHTPAGLSGHPPGWKCHRDSHKANLATDGSPLLSRTRQAGRVQQTRSCEDWYNVSPLLRSISADDLLYCSSSSFLVPHRCYLNWSASDVSDTNAMVTLIRAGITGNSAQSSCAVSNPVSLKVTASLHSRPFREQIQSVGGAVNNRSSGADVVKTWVYRRRCLDIPETYPSI